MDLKFIIVLTGISALVVMEAMAEEEPSNLRMDLRELLMEAKDAVRIAKLRQALARRSQRQRMQAESMKAERIRAEREAKHAVADVEAAVEEANTALKSLKRVAGEPEDREMDSHRRHSSAAPSPSASSGTGELTDPDETSADVKKLVKKTHENLEKKPNNEIVISKGMTKDVVKTNGQVAKKMVKESEDKKANGEEIVDKQANLEIDREPSAADPEDPQADALKAEGKTNTAATGCMFQVINFLAVLAFTFVLVF